ncbi:MAG: hypothetical protein ACI9JL_002044 [Paracoccaceae bacterium]
MNEQKPLFVFFGAESEYVLHPMFSEMTKRGHRCAELHATPEHSIAGELASVIADPAPKVLVTSSHFSWDDRYMMSAMGVPDCPALVEIIAALQPIYTVYYPHDLSQPLLTNETSCLPLIDLYLAATPLERMFSRGTHVKEVGWIKTPSDIGVPADRWGRGLWLTMSMEYILVENGTEKTLGYIEKWLHDWLSIKFAPFPQFAELEGILTDRGINIIDHNMTPPDAARHFDFVVTNGESSVVRESAMMGIPTYIVTGIGLFGKTSSRNIWQFNDLKNVHIVETLDDIPDETRHTPPTMLPFDMDTAIDAIVTGYEQNVGH